MQKLATMQMRLVSPVLASQVSWCGAGTLLPTPAGQTMPPLRYCSVFLFLVFVAQQGSLAVCRLHYVCGWRCAAQLRSTHHYLPGRDEIMVAESKRYGAVGDEAGKQLQGPRPVGRAHDLPLCAWHAHSRTRSQQLAGSALRSGCWCTSWGVHRCSIT